MKETVTSLRLYFGIVGAFLGISTLFTLTPFIVAGGLMYIFLLPPILLLQLVTGLVWTVGYIYFAFTLPNYLNPKRSKFIKLFLVLPVAASIVWNVIGLFGYGSVDILALVVGVLITWYLYATVKRLSKSTPAPTPAPTVVPVVPEL